MKSEELNSTWLNERVAKLANTITDCMILNEMTVECLDEACKRVRGE